MLVALVRMAYGTIAGSLSGGAQRTFEPAHTPKAKAPPTHGRIVSQTVFG